MVFDVNIDNNYNRLQLSTNISKDLETFKYGYK